VDLLALKEAKDVDLQDFLLRVLANMDEHPFISIWYEVHSESLLIFG
jgi:hypothetical protein